MKVSIQLYGSDTIELQGGLLTVTGRIPGYGEQSVDMTDLANKRLERLDVCSSDLQISLDLANGWRWRMRLDHDGMFAIITRHKYDKQKMPYPVTDEQYLAVDKDGKCHWVAKPKGYGKRPSDTLLLPIFNEPEPEEPEEA